MMRERKIVSNELGDRVVLLVGVEGPLSVLGGLGPGLLCGLGPGLGVGAGLSVTTRVLLGTCLSSETSSLHKSF